MKWFITVTALALCFTFSAAKGTDKTYPKKVTLASVKPTKSPKSPVEEFTSLPPDDLAFIKEVDKQFKLHGEKIKFEIERENTTTKTNKRTIDGELGYGLQNNAFQHKYQFSKPRYQIYPYSQRDIPPIPIHNGFTHQQFLRPGVQIQPSQAYEIKEIDGGYQAFKPNAQPFVPQFSQKDFSSYNLQQSQQQNHIRLQQLQQQQQQQYQAISQHNSEPVIVLKIPGPAKYASHLQALLQQYLEIRAAQYIREIQENEARQQQQQQEEQSAYYSQQVQYQHPTSIAPAIQYTPQHYSVAPTAASVVPAVQYTQQHFSIAPSASPALHYTQQHYIPSTTAAPAIHYNQQQFIAPASGPSAVHITQQQYTAPASEPSSVQYNHQHFIAPRPTYTPQYKSIIKPVEQYQSQIAYQATGNANEVQEDEDHQLFSYDQQSQTESPKYETSTQNFRNLAFVGSLKPRKFPAYTIPSATATKYSSGSAAGDESLPISENNPRETHTKVVFNGVQSEDHSSLYPLPPVSSTTPKYYYERPSSYQQPEEQSVADTEAPTLTITQRPHYNYQQQQEQQQLSEQQSQQQSQQISYEPNFKGDAPYSESQFKKLNDLISRLKQRSAAPYKTHSSHV